MTGGDQEQCGLTQEERVRRAKVAAAARWSGRGESKLIRVDPAAAEALQTVPAGDRRALASSAIIEAVGRYAQSDRA